MKPPNMLIEASTIAASPKIWDMPKTAGPAAISAPTMMTDESHPLRRLSPRDYVVLVDVNQGTYGADDESRHLLHIGATRAAHQLWLVSSGPPSSLVPAWLR